jgi:hypothetical protein
MCLEWEVLPKHCTRNPDHNQKYDRLQRRINILAEMISSSLYFTQRRMNLLKPLFMHLPGSTSVGDTTVVLQEVDYYVLGINHMTAKHPTPE